MAHAALPALLPTPPKWKMLPLLPTPCLCVAAILGLPKPLAEPSPADSDERWDTRKTKPASIESSASSTPRSADSVRTSSAGRGSSRKNATLPPPKLGRADSVERWDAHKKASSSSAASSSSSSGTSPLVSTTCTISRASPADRLDVHKKHRPPQAKAFDDGESSAVLAATTSTRRRRRYYGSRGQYTQGPGFAVAVPESSMLPMATAFLVRVA